MASENVSIGDILARRFPRDRIPQPEMNYRESPPEFNYQVESIDISNELEYSESDDYEYTPDEDDNL